MRAAFFSFPWLTRYRAPIIHPPTTSSTGNRIYTAVRESSELSNYLLFKEPLVLNFTIRGNKKCNKLTQPLYDYVSEQTTKKINVVDIECDEVGTRELMQRYVVSDIPCLVVLKDQIPAGRYVDRNLTNDENSNIDLERLKAFIDLHGLD
ncbi:hypothetical protein BABINDRAFT_168825 [Babjeviella inositovora NRRL Y-12698]|uniref:Thioredoxin domain-containing protein n=1 Tax=Babjeviella inositovora NRRL Y-12698 TaxID=984486 RepID=A0A1E3QJR5_9ASCO|nr:uncharacterized protein BABINDRAFT_168825 [Babjeviella inositovora NRRL Y-12698]ODQ77868.1 hypothetical protein BABINDRAFT_168825 [Babjeviella inositovora NRRL Y-12698]